MIKIFIESKSSLTPEYNFLVTILRVYNFNSQPWEIVPIDGKDSLHLARNHFIQNTMEGGVNLIIFDADSENNGGGYEKRKKNY